MTLAFAGLVTLVVCVFLSAGLSWSGPVDPPRARGMHTAPTPTAGGLAIMGGVFAGLLMLDLDVSAPTGRAVAWALAFAAVHGVIGALDDVFDLGAKAKLGAQIILALAFAALAAHPQTIALTDTFTVRLPDIAAVLGTALWLVVVINAVNFMDGSNGLVAGSMAIVAGGLALLFSGWGAGPAPMVLFCLTLACLGFLPFNFPKAAVFQGDAGALFVGALLAAMAVIGPAAEPARLSLWVGPIALAPFLTDVLLTLLARARRGEPLLQAHRDHLYQRWRLARGDRHADLAFRVWGIMGGFMLAAVAADYAAPTLATLIFLFSLGAAILGWFVIDRRLRPSG